MQIIVDALGDKMSMFLIVTPLGRFEDPKDVMNARQMRRFYGRFGFEQVRGSRYQMKRERACRS